MVVLVEINLLCTLLEILARRELTQTLSLAIPEATELRLTELREIRLMAAKTNQWSACFFLVVGSL